MTGPIRAAISMSGVLLMGLTLGWAGCGGSEANGAGCAESTLKGSYVYAQDGFTISGDTATQRTPFAQGGRELFGGDGTMSGTARQSQRRRRPLDLRGDVHRKLRLYRRARAWALRGHVSAYDALYVAAAQVRSAALLTADGPLARAPRLGVVVHNVRAG